MPGDNTNILNLVGMVADPTQMAQQDSTTPPPRSPTVMGAAQFAHMQRRFNGVQPTQHRSHVPPEQIGRMGGGLPDWTYDAEKDNA